MFDAVTALGGRTASGTIAQIAEAPLQGMITLRGVVKDTGFAAAVAEVSGLSVPKAGETTAKQDIRLCWMSPDELLLLCPYADAEDYVSRFAAAMADVHAMAVNVSDARAMFGLSGPHARDVLAKLCPVDLSTAAFGPGAFRRTRMAQTPAAFWTTAEDAFQIVCFRSQAGYVFDLLTVAAQRGSEVGHLTGHS
ncbi:MAG: sarcosine oxidase subunit gamma [Roseobacter sp.]